MEDEYYIALLDCGYRYKEMLLDYIEERISSRSIQLYDLLTFIIEYNDGCQNKLPLMKLNRWLGYIQGTMIHLGITNVETERNWTRPLFKHLDFG